MECRQWPKLAALVATLQNGYPTAKCLSHNTEGHVQEMRGAWCMAWPWTAFGCNCILWDAVCAVKKDALCRNRRTDDVRPN
eukprot:358313-Chlamydomonas_euryale.AAC.6